MKVACISNQNNGLHAMVRFLRDRGIDAELLLLKDETESYIYHPKNDCFDNSYKKYTHNLSWGSFEDNFLKLTFDKKLKRQIRDSLKDYDFLITGSLVPAYLELAGLRSGMFVCHGNDARVLPFYKRKAGKAGFIKHNTRAYYQKSGIKNSISVLTGLNAIIETKKLGPKGRVIDYPPPSFYANAYKGEVFQSLISEEDDFQNLVRKIRGENDLFILSPKRQGWNLYGNDKMIRAYGRFKKETSIDSKLVFFEGGWDMPKSKQLIDQLGIEDSVVWLPKTSRFNVMYALQLADLCLADVIVHPPHYFSPYIIGGTATESWGMGKPLLFARDDDFTNKHFSKPPPICKSNTEEDIYEHFMTFIKDKTKYQTIGQAGLEWYNQIIEKETIDVIIDTIMKSNGQTS